MYVDRLEKQMEFLMEVDQLKQIEPMIARYYQLF